MIRQPKKVTVRARVRVMLMVDVTDVWGGDCPVSQIHSQAIDSARGYVERVVRGQARDGDVLRVQLLGDETVEAVVVESNA